MLAGAGGSRANCKSPIFIFPSQAPLTILLSNQMHRTNFSQPPRILNQAPHLTFQSLMVLFDDPLATSWSLCWRQAMPLLCPFRVQTNSQVLMLQSLRVLSPEVDMTYLIIKVYYTVSSTGAKDKAYSGISGRSHVPHNNEVVLGTGHHQSIAEALSGNGLIVVDQRVQNFTRVHIPFTYETGAIDSEEPVTMARSSYWRQRTESVCPINTFNHPKLVLSQFVTELPCSKLVIFSPSVDAFANFRASLNPLQIVSSTQQVRFYRLCILDNLWV